MSMCTGREINPFPETKMIIPNLKKLQMTIFKFDDNGGNFSERVENTVEKGEFAHHEQLLLFPQHFQKTCAADT